MKNLFDFLKKHMLKFIIELVAIVFTLISCTLIFAYMYQQNADEFRSALPSVEMSAVMFHENSDARLYEIQTAMLELDCVAYNRSYYGIAYIATSNSNAILTSSKTSQLMMNVHFDHKDFYFHNLEDYFSTESIEDFLKFKSDMDCEDSHIRNAAISHLIHQIEGYYDSSMNFIPFKIVFQNTYYDGSYTLINEEVRDSVSSKDIVTYTNHNNNDNFADIVITDSNEYAEKNAWYNFSYGSMDAEDIGLFATDFTDDYSYKLSIYIDVIGYTLHSPEFIRSCVLLFLILQLISVVIIALHSYITKRNRMHAEMKALFLNAMAHEMKTPVAVSVNCIECIKNNVNPEKNEHYLSIINEENLRLNTLLENMLTYTRISDSGYKIIKEEISMIKAVRQAASHFTAIIEQKNIDLQYDIEADFKITGDSKLIGMVLDNYISNATKHCNENGKLKIHIDDKSLSVFNEGAHIKEENLAKIWEPLFKEDASRSEETGSAGMGLAISAEILKQHGLEYGVENSKDGVTFYIGQKGTIN